MTQTQENLTLAEVLSQLGSTLTQIEAKTNRLCAMGLVPGNDVASLVREQIETDGQIKAYMALFGNRDELK